MKKNNDIENLLYSLNNLLPFSSNYVLSYLGVNLGLKTFKKIIDNFYEDKLKDINKKDLFGYLISNRLFVESLSDNEIKEYYIILKKLYKLRIRKKIRNFFNFKME